MEWLRKTINDNIDLIIAVVIGFAVFAIYQVLFVTDGIFATFVETVISSLMDLVKNKITAIN